MRSNFVEGGRATRKGFFVRILEALHRARRRDAIRVLRRYRHLMAGQAQVRPVKSPPMGMPKETICPSATVPGVGETCPGDAIPPVGALPFD